MEYSSAKYLFLRTLTIAFTVSVGSSTINLVAAAAMWAPATADPVAAESSESATLLDATTIEALVAPVALYPDELLGIVLPASTYPIQVVQAARYLEARKQDPSLQPGEEWDDTIIALLNYPEVIALLNSDLDWTWTLGGAVLNQQPDVIEAVEKFRERARAAGNLESDEHKIVSYDNEVLEIASADPETIYVPYYEPAQVIYPQTTAVYRYYPVGYPLYYYPYPAGYSFYSGAFWGVRTAYTVGWITNRLHVHRYGYRSHPYYGHRYHERRFRRHSSRAPRHYIGAPRRHHRNYRGDYWRAGNRHGHRPRGYRREHDRRASSNTTRRGRPVANRHETRHGPATSNRRVRKPQTPRFGGTSPHATARADRRSRGNPDTVTGATRRRPSRSQPRIEANAPGPERAVRRNVDSPTRRATARRQSPAANAVRSASARPGTDSITTAIQRSRSTPTGHTDRRSRPATRRTTRSVNSTSTTRSRSAVRDGPRSNSGSRPARGTQQRNASAVNRYTQGLQARIKRSTDRAGRPTNHRNRRGGRANRGSGNRAATGHGGRRSFGRMR